MFCPAKINLFLKVTAKRPDGYHDLETVFLPVVDLADTLTLSEAKPNATESTVSVNGSFTLPDNASNLCLKALRAFEDATGKHPVVKLNLTKRIPLSAGLGGGSSDAAGTLKLLDQYCQTNLTPKQLWEIARTIGADVPFFLNPTVALGKGIGDILTPIPLTTNLTFLLITPCFPIPVVWAFQNLTRTQYPNANLEDFLCAMQSGDAKTIAKYCHNDLEYAIFDKFPILTFMKDWLMSQDDVHCVHVSGSGPSLFALLTPDKAQSVRNAFTCAFPNTPQPSIMTCQATTSNAAGIPES